MNSYQVPVSHSVLRLIYSVCMLLLIPVLLVVFRKKLVQHSPELKNRKFSERFGSLPENIRTGGIHIHCVSVGEVNAASGLINDILSQFPNIVITLTTSSTTGAQHAFNVFKDRVQHSYMPFDFPFFISRFYRKLQPSMVLITEVEIWPNQIAHCHQHNITTVLINARMTNQSLKNYKRLAWLLRPTLRQVNLTCAQSAQSYENFLSYGVYKAHLKMSRNMKFDLLPNDEDEALGKEIIRQSGFENRQVLLAGSTHSPEEKIVLDVYLRLKSQLPELSLIIVPRHPHRFEEAYQIAKATGIDCAKLSEYFEEDASTSKGNMNIDCIVVDQMGMLKACYSVCTIAFVGGSFAQKGGHNALEAAVYAKPIIMGPSQFNNPAICNYLQTQGALKTVDSEDTFFNEALLWLNNEEGAEADGANGSRVLLKNAGSVEYTMSELRPYLSKINKAADIIQ